MKIEESTKRFWAGCMTMMLVMFANFYLYVSPHPCEGSASMCDTCGKPTSVSINHYAFCSPQCREAFMERYRQGQGWR